MLKLISELNNVSISSNFFKKFNQETPEVKEVAVRPFKKRCKPSW